MGDVTGMFYTVYANSSYNVKTRISSHGTGLPRNLIKTISHVLGNTIMGKKKKMSDGWMDGWMDGKMDRWIDR